MASFRCIVDSIRSIKKIINSFLLISISLWLFPNICSGAESSEHKVGGPLAHIFLNFSRTPPPGFNHTRVAPLKTSPPYDYPDGTHCDTGQEPFNNSEVQLLTDYTVEEYYAETSERLRKTIQAYKDELSQLGFAGTRTFFDFRLMVNESVLLQDRCESKMCHYDHSKFSPVCGPRSNNSFADGLSCFDGAMPLPEHELGGLRVARTKEEIPQMYYLQMQERAKDEFLTENCKSKKCHFDLMRDWFICGSSSTLPEPLRFCFIFVLFTIYAFTQSKPGYLSA